LILVSSSSSSKHEVFSFNLAEGYTETDNLFLEIQSKFTNASGDEITRESDGSTTVQHVGETDTPTIVSVSHDSSNYLNSLSFDSGTQDKVIGLYVDDQNKHTIWESLGFDKRRNIKSTDLADIQAQLNTLAPVASPLDIQGFIPPSLLHMRGCKSSEARPSPRLARDGLLIDRKILVHLGRRARIFQLLAKALHSNFAFESICFRGPLLLHGFQREDALYRVVSFL
jgi:hypothetical protein